jgi:hypothetical protein
MFFFCGGSAQPKWVNRVLYKLETMGFNQNSISTSPEKSNICVDQSDLQTRNGDRPKRIFHVKRIPEQERIE